MSISHFFYVIPKIKEFPDELLKTLEKDVNNNANLINGECIFSKDTIAIPFIKSRPGYFFITLNKDKAMLNIKDAAYFSFVKYDRNNVNDFLIRLILISKYYLRENLVVASDDFDCGIPENWVKISKELSDEGFSIGLSPSLRTKEINFRIDGEKISNVFDEDNSIQKIVFTPIKKE